MATSDNGGDSSLPSSVVVVPPALSFGTIVKEFPDFLFCVLTYIADRVIWNSIASSNKDIHKKSKAIIPPWPICYKLPSFDCVAWSPCGTRIACLVYRTELVIFDQRLGPLPNNGHINAHDGCHIDGLKYSPNGRFLVSAGLDGFVKLWDNVTGIYEQLQEWNMKEEVARELTAVLPKFCISACSKYIVVSLGTWVFLKDAEGKTKSYYDNRIHISNIMFSSDDRAIFICCDGMIKVWRPYLGDDDEGRLITLTSRPDSGARLSVYNTYQFSNDNTMVVIHNVMTNTGRILWSIDTDNNYLTQKSKLPTEGMMYFTPDDKYIVCNKENRPKCWSLGEGKFTNNPIHFFDNGSNYTKHNNLVVMSLSPNDRQCIVGDRGTGIRYITSYFVT